MKQDKIVIIDLGSTENTELARQIRSLNVYSEILPHDTLELSNNVKGIILNGGPNRNVDGVDVDIDTSLYEKGIPMISIDHPTSNTS
ncbi:MAG TPA: glutamine-hydrolyzing GMP synthase, partial [Erysipelothrix sp.]|nr:glutamine-hydrolyzing GMP synthase [Erysipelothrix sp.]